MRRIAFLAVCAVVCCGFSGHGLLAQDESATSKSSPRRGPLPFHYGKLGMSDEQRNEAYAIIDSYEVKIDELKKQLKALLVERENKLQSMLSDGQKLRLKELLDEAQKKAGTPEPAEGNVDPL